MRWLKDSWSLLEMLVYPIIFVVVVYIMFSFLDGILYITR